MNPPEIRYAKRGDLNIAFQVLGDAELDLVYCAEFWNSLEAQWMEPRFDAFLRNLASFTRLIMFDQTGTGLSDPLPGSALPPIEQWMDDVRAVMDATKSARAALLGSGGGALMSMVFAATYPDRTSALVLLNAAARLSPAPDYPWGSPRQFEGDWRERSRTEWGRGGMADLVAPSAAGDPEFREWWARTERLGIRPGMNERLDRMALEVDIRHVLPSIQAPTLVLARRGNRLVSADHSRYLAQHIPVARYVELPGRDHLPFIGDADAIVGEIQEFLTGARQAPEANRVLATVLFTDIVGSTERAVALGDHDWRDLLDRHDHAVRQVLTRFRGREIATAGDSFLATFDGPGRAIRAGKQCAIRCAHLDSRCGLGFTPARSSWLVETSVVSPSTSVHAWRRWPALEKSSSPRP